MTLWYNLCSNLLLLYWKILSTPDTSFQMLKYLLHVIPVCDDPMFYGVFQGQDTSLALSFITYVAVFLTHTNHHSLKNDINNVTLSCEINQ